ncbi:cytochrome c biogenesis CcdA family protein [Rickettsiales bacterium]|nr:cytochrome c biogenesis CcdA family protein [Rickettsiales bacterium]
MTIFISAFIAGLLTSLSPCVILALPFVINSALIEGKKGPLFLSAGLITAFVLFGILFSGVFSFFNLEQESVKFFAAIFLLILSLFFIFPSLNQKLSNKTSIIANFANNSLNSIKTNGLLGQFIIGLFLGAIWTPCSGPTLGFALTLIAIKQEILHGALIMLIFGIAAIIPLIIIAYISKNAISKNSNKIQNLYGRVKLIMGILIFLYSFLVIMGWDLAFEGLLLDLMPEFIFNIITKY